MQNKNLTVVLVIVILLALGLVTYWFIQKDRNVPTTNQETPIIFGPQEPTTSETSTVTPETPENTTNTTNTEEVPQGY